MNFYFHILIILLLLCNLISALQLGNNKPPSQIDKSMNTKYNIVKDFYQKTEFINQIILKNPLSNVIINLYDFFYWLPRRNIIYDLPPEIWRNASLAQYIQWFQVPHNLPPYRYLGNAWPEG